MLRAYGVTDKGRIRPINEDFMAIDEAHALCVVADGMGGHNAGEVAARMAVEAVLEFVVTAGDKWPFGFDSALSEAGNRLRTAIQLANLQILELSADSNEYTGMGTTVVAALVHGTQLSVAYVGDSRLYLLVEGRLRQVTNDDSWMASVLAHDPDADLAKLRNHPLRNALTNAVGARPRTEVHVVEETLSGGERLLLSTDGVHGVLEDEQIQQLMLAGDDLRVTASNIVAAALDGGSRDNCTALVAQYLAD